MSKTPNHRSALIPAAILVAAAALTMNVSSHAQEPDPEQAEYVRETTAPRQQPLTSPADRTVLTDDTPEHADHVETDDELTTYRLRPARRPSRSAQSGELESPEHRDHIETLEGSDRKASHPTLWAPPQAELIEDRAEVLPPPVTELPEGMKFIDGDLVGPEDFGGGVAATFTTSAFWPNGIVPYRFDANVSGANQALMIAAMNDWEAIANINFRPIQSGDASFLHIQDASFNASEAIGIAGGRHDIWIVSWNNWAIIMHELGHALAYYHEQSRFDRNSYINVNFDNVSQSQCSGQSCDSQFTFRLLGDDEYGPYDFDSVMHYGQCAFSKCNNTIPICTTRGCGCAINPGICTTIDVLPPNEDWQDRIGQRTHLSYFDQKTMTMLYPENDFVFLDWMNQDINPNPGTFDDPYAFWFQAEDAVPAGGTVWIKRPGTYTAGLISKRLLVRAPMGAILRP